MSSPLFQLFGYYPESFLLPNLLCQLLQVLLYHLKMVCNGRVTGDGRILSGVAHGCYFGRTPVSGGRKEG